MPLNAMNDPNWINVSVYMVTQHHGIVIFHNPAFCLRRGDARVEILDKKLRAFDGDASTMCAHTQTQKKTVTSVLNTDFIEHVPYAMSAPGGCVSFVSGLIGLA